MWNVHHRNNKLRPSRADRDLMPVRWIVFRSDGMKQRLLVLRFIVTGSGRYVWRSLKNCVKFLLGRKPRRDEWMLFFQQYILHLTGLRPIWGITCAAPSGREGAG